MSVYFVTGNLGSGKSLSCVARMQQYLNRGCRVATNLDLYLENLLDLQSRQTTTRIPDKPNLENLQALGCGSCGAPQGQHKCCVYDEKKFGALVLDELGTWLNSRAYNDKDRGPVIDWFLHARKYKWDLYLIVQDESIIDKQIRETIMEHKVVCRRMDKLRIPLIGGLLSMLGWKQQIPRLHVAIVQYRTMKQIVDRWWYRGNQYFRAYDTEQVFVADRQINNVDMRAIYTNLSAYTLKGRFQAQLSGFEVFFLCFKYCVGLLLWPLFNNRSVQLSGLWNYLVADSRARLSLSRAPGPVLSAPPAGPGRVA